MQGKTGPSLKAPVYGMFEGPEPKLYGHLVWDGSRLTADPPGDPVLQYLLDSPVLLGDGYLSPRGDPEKWVKNAHRGFRGTYLWVGPAEEV